MHFRPSESVLLGGPCHLSGRPLFLRQARPTSRYLPRCRQPFSRATLRRPNGTGSHPGLYLMIKKVGMRGRVLSFAPMARRGHLSIKNLREPLKIKEETVNESHRQGQTRSHLPSMSHNKCTRSSSKGPSNSTTQEARGSCLR